MGICEFKFMLLQESGKRKRMEKLTDKEKKCMKTKKRRISWNLLCCYLVILLAPTLSTVLIYNMAKTAMTDNQKERIQNSLSQVNTALDQEIQMAQNVGYYVSREKRLVNYLSGMREGTVTQPFYEQYTVASNYPNYSLTNQIIKNVYILVADSDYVMRIPQVLPKNDRGIATLGGFPLYSYERFQEFYENQDQTKKVFYYEGESGEGTLFLPCQLVYPGILDNQCAIIVELDWNRIAKMIRPVLGGNTGVVALVDSDGVMLEKYQVDEKGVTKTSGRSLAFDQVQKELGWKNVETFSINCGYNGWKLAAVVPSQVLTQRIGPVRYISVAICVTAIMVGIMICLSYWYKQKNMVQEYFSLQERIKKTDDKGAHFWKGFEGFLSEVVDLHNIVEKQEVMLQEAFLRKLLYGNYESEEEILEAATSVHIALDDGSFCVVNLELDDPLQQENPVNPSRDIILGMADQLLKDCMPWHIWRYRVSELSSVFVIHEKTEIDREKLKKDLENLNFQFHSQLRIKGFIGISDTVKEPVEIARQYEISSRVCEFARFQGIRIPVFPEDLPGEKILEQPVFFTIDMEMKLISLLRSGNLDQIEEMITQIRTMYLYQGMDPYIYRHTVETLRGCVFRSIPGENEEAKERNLSSAAAKANSAEEMFCVMRKVGVFWADSAKEREEAQLNIDKEKIVAYIEEHYGDPCLNLSVVAEWAGEPERKLYNAFKGCFGVSFSSYLEQLRIAHACELLKQGVAVKDIATSVGYCSDYSFRRAFKRAVGVPPSDYRKCQTV